MDSFQDLRREAGKYCGPGKGVLGLCDRGVPFAAARNAKRLIETEGVSVASYA